MVFTAKGIKKYKESKERLKPAKKTGQSTILSFSVLFMMVLERWKKTKRASNLRKAGIDKAKLLVKNKEIKTKTKNNEDNQKRPSILIFKL